MSNPRLKNKSRHHELSPSESESDKVEHGIAALEQKLKENKHKDKHVEHKLDKLQHKVYDLKKEQSKKHTLDYKMVVHKLRREKHLMVNGSDAYGTFFSHSVQTIKSNEMAVFEKRCNVLNLKLKVGGDKIKVSRSGMYMLNFTALFDQPSQIAFFVNDVPELSTVSSSANPNNMVSVHQILKLYCDDVLSLRNYLSPGDINTSASSGLIPHSTNLELSLYRIAPIPEKGCLPPCPESSDSDSEHCEKK
jgi:hypothetical protein